MRIYKSAEKNTILKEIRSFFNRNKRAIIYNGENLHYFNILNSRYTRKNEVENIIIYYIKIV